MQEKHTQDQNYISILDKSSDTVKVNVWDKSVKVEQSSYYWQKKPLVSEGGDLLETKPIVVELFCGCGGTSMGFQMAGFEIAIGCDILIPAIDTFKHNHPNTSTILGDVKKVEASQIKEILKGRTIDVLVAGVPCQGFSLNNRKRHKEDARNLLYLEFFRFVEELKPKAIVLENVSGMKSTGNFVEEIEKSLSKAGGMKVTSKLLFAPDYGVPQKRTRLVFIGVKGQEFNFDSIEKTHGVETGNPYVTIKEAIGDLPSLSSGEEKFLYEKEPFSDYQKMMRVNASSSITGHRSPRHPKSTVEKIKNTIPGEPMYPRFKQRIRLAWDILSPTQVSGGIRPQFQLGHPADARGLTIRERCRIQSFPDDFEVKGGTVQARVQTGNAVPPLLAKAIALALKKCLKDEL